MAQVPCSVSRYTAFRHVLPIFLVVFLACIPAAAQILLPCSLTSGNAVFLSEYGTATSGGVLPEIPQNASITTKNNCGTLTAVAAPTYPGPGRCQLPASLPNHWLTATMSGNTVTFVALANPYLIPRNGSITVSSSNGGSTTISVIENAANDPVLLRDVRVLYQSVLGRDPDASGQGFWTGAGATSGTAALGQMTDSFVASAEDFNTNFAVMAAYQAATGAPPTYAQFWSAASAIRAGTQSVAGLYTSLLGANNSATPDTVSTLYNNLLNRGPLGGEIASAESQGLANWFQTLIGYPATSSIAAAIGAQANEFQSTGGFTTDHSNSLYISMLYFLILGRDRDTAGYNYWLRIANGGGPGLLFQGAAGAQTRINMMGTSALTDPGFTMSAEFGTLFNCQ